MASQIPPLLDSYLSLPPETSQIVLTGILGASTNWLTLRYLYSLLRPAAAAAPRHNGDGDADGAGGDVKVLLVSFMRDHAFWKEGAGRLVCFVSHPPSCLSVCSLIPYNPCARIHALTRCTRRASTSIPWRREASSSSSTASAGCSWAVATGLPYHPPGAAPASSSSSSRCTWTARASPMLRGCWAGPSRGCRLRVARSS